MSVDSVHLSRAGVSVVLTRSAAGVPVFAYWGAGLGAVDPAVVTRLQTPGVPHSALDEPRVRGVLSENAAGFTGLPALEGFRPGATTTAWAPLLRDWSWDLDQRDEGRVTLTSDDTESGWAVQVDVELTVEGLVRLRTHATNTGTDALVVTAVRCALPVAHRASELLDLTGRWCREATPQRRPWLIGTHLREGRHGRTGHDASLLMVAGTPGFGFGSGEVWATHLAWSGNHAAYAERTPEGECLLGGGELLGPGEVELQAGETYTSPWLVGSHSASGLDDASARLHGWLRRQSPLGERPVLINTWEAVYFDHDLAGLTDLVDAAAAVGVERFVLDDGWFHGRSSDRAGLGDWTVDRQRWPHGLQPLIDSVHRASMDFGLWVEPEMVNEDSDLAREHPDWILRGRSELPGTWRHQQVLDLQHPDAYAHVRDALMAILDEYAIAFLKWDHNRDLIDVAHGGRPAVHGQTLAFYRLLDELRAAHPGLEIESCSSGGARIDLEVLTRTDRVWPSDTIDALERQRIQRWTSLLVPPERMGAHVGGPIAHTTGRHARLGFRAATALLGHFGIEWDVRKLTTAERDELASWVALHKRVRPVLATGRLVRGDDHDPAVVVSGVVAPDGAEGWYVIAIVDTVVTQAAPSVLLPGLDPDHTYLLSMETPAGDVHTLDLGTTWLDGEPLRVTGAMLGTLGVRLPTLAPGTAVVLRAVACPRAEGDSPIAAGDSR